MPSLVFDKGYKEYDINGDKDAVIRVYTTDWNILQRLADLKKRIIEKVRGLENLDDKSGFKDVMGKLNDVEREVRAEVDAAFGSPVSDTAFGNLNCLSFTPATGKPIVLNFLEAIIPLIQADFEGTLQTAEKAVSKYTGAVKDYK